MEDKQKVFTVKRKEKRNLPLETSWKRNRMGNKIIIPVVNLQEIIDNRIIILNAKDIIVIIITPDPINFNSRIL